MSALGIFKVKKEERWLALAMLLVFISFNALLIGSHYGVYTMGAHDGFWTIFTKNFRMSGYDNWSWITISGMRIHFETSRHPLYLTLLYPMYLVNHWLIYNVGTNFAVFFMAFVIVISAFYSVIFMYRILREVLQLSRFDATLLTLLMFSFAHVMVPTMVPDHFIISMMLLLMTFYISGMKMRKSRLLRPWQTAVLLFFTAGMATSNGIKTLIASLFTNGKRTFHPKFILLGIVLPAAILVGIQQWQYYALEVPQKEVIRNIEIKSKQKNPEKVKSYTKQRTEWLNQHTGENMGEGVIGKLMDISTPRMETLIENFFGESIQLHQQYLLKDVSWDRPIFVKYNWTANYIIEGIIVLLFILGGFIGRRERFFQMLLLCFSCDIALHLILGFGINEVYIMTAGWIFIIPIAFAYLLQILAFAPRRIFRFLLLALTAWLWVYNGGQIIDYLI